MGTLCQMLKAWVRRRWEQRASSLAACRLLRASWVLSEPGTKVGHKVYFPNTGSPLMNSLQVLATALFPQHVDDAPDGSI